MCAILQINAEKSPYLTDKLKIWMLPTLALIKNEKVDDYVVGFSVSCAYLAGRDCVILALRGTNTRAT